MRLTQRDCQTVHLVLRLHALRDDQIQTALFSLRASSPCQRRLTRLVAHGYLDRLPRRYVNEPAVYVLSRRSITGNRLIRELWGEEELRRYKGQLGPLHHLLAVNDLRVRVERACRDLGWNLVTWQRPEELAPLLRGVDLVPDAYFQIRRTVDGRPKTSAFFVELERAFKSSHVLRSKLVRYCDLYYSGEYERIFQTPALRLLVVFAPSDRFAPSPTRLQQALADAERLGVTIARFQHLETIKSLSPSDCLLADVWAKPGEAQPSALFRDPS